ncbi:MAG: hypothetical protein B7X04_00715 [Parcubacteria group bacterium 21-54-25]|nr:MAG: hypothetical protein B7X04_00715 [Parcubacteria group bacterium 21-54-25]HQU07968.1 hypothetical protein [Candidatus Paceibacterota bacterium]
MNKHTVVIALIALVVGAGGGYWSGHALAQSSPSTSGTVSGTFSPGGRTSFRGSNTSSSNGSTDFLTGTIAKEGAGSITLSLRDGSSKIVLLTPNTAISKSVAGSTHDLAVGATVIVNGAANSDGSVSASLIQLRPQTRASTNSNSAVAYP